MSADSSRPRQTPGRPARLVGEGGSVSVLGLGAFVIALALIAVGIDATYLQLRRTELWNLADAAALSAAHALDHQRYFSGELPDPAEGLALAGRHVRQAATSHLAAAAGARVPARLVEASAPDGASARVVLAARVRPPLTGRLLGVAPGGIEIRAQARARAGSPAGRFSLDP